VAYVALILVALMPAAGMILIGLLSTGSVRRSLMLFALCGLWVVLGVIFWIREGWFFGLLTIAQAISGMGGWIGSILSRLAQPIAADPNPAHPGTSSVPTSH
jgi:hypothetical protein